MILVHHLVDLSPQGGPRLAMGGPRLNQVAVGPILVRSKWTKISHQVDQDWPGAKSPPKGRARVPKEGPKGPQMDPEIIRNHEKVLSRGILKRTLETY